MTGPADTPSHLVVGAVRQAVGLRGEVEVVVMSDDPKRFEPGSQVQVADGEWLTVRRVRTHRGRTIVTFEELADRTEAEPLRGCELVVPRAEARALGDDEYWDFELVGCLVTTLEGEEVGRVTEVLHPPANDVLVVRADDEEYLIPLIRDIVRLIDPDSRRIEIEPIPGLLEQ